MNRQMIYISFFLCLLLAAACVPCDMENVEDEAYWQEAVLSDPDSWLSDTTTWPKSDPYSLYPRPFIMDQGLLYADTLILD